jgi:hypothetical protein
MDLKTIPNEDMKKLFTKLADPLLSPSGRYASKKNGLVIQRILTEEHSIKNGIIIGCSVLLRSMLTAFFISRKWTKPPEKIIVFPYLREIDEGSDDKYSDKSINSTNSNPGYCMRSLKEQKELLSKIGILKYFDFTFVEYDENLRKETGDITKFIIWSKNKFLDNQNPKLSITKPLNFIVITHAGVLRDYAKSSFYNNTGIIVKTTFNPVNKNLTIKSFYNLVKDLLVDPDFIHKYNTNTLIKFNTEEFETILNNINEFLDIGYSLSDIPINKVYDNIKWYN